MNVNNIPGRLSALKAEEERLMITDPNGSRVSDVKFEIERLEAMEGLADFGENLG